MGAGIEGQSLGRSGGGTEAMLETRPGKAAPSEAASVGLTGTGGGELVGEPAAAAARAVPRACLRSSFMLAGLDTVVAAILAVELTACILVEVDLDSEPWPCSVLAEGEAPAAFSASGFGCAAVDSKVLVRDVLREATRHPPSPALPTDRPPPPPRIGLGAESSP